MMQRRNLLYVGAALAAAVAGAGVAWRRAQPDAGAVANTPVDAFWALEFETPDGAPLKISTFAGQPLLLNFWATWCPPCVEELPLLNRFAKSQQARGWRVLGLAVDQPSAVRTWLKKSPLDFPVAMAGLEGTDLSKRLGNLTGGLPFSVAFGAKGAVLQRKGGQLTPEDLDRWAQMS